MRFSDGLKFYQEARPPGREISANLGRFETLPMEEASLATSVPAIPIAIPMLAYLNAGASLTPSPVMAVICLSSFDKISTIYLLCFGSVLANTFLIILNKFKNT